VAAGPVVAIPRNPPNGPAALCASLAKPQPLNPHDPPPPTPTARGALLERVESRAYSERYIAVLVQSILRFIAQCHAKGIVYRDVKPGALGGDRIHWVGGAQA